MYAFCRSQLVDVISNDKSMIFIRFGVVRNVKIWNTRCHSCYFDCQHSNIASGLFNFDRRVFISLDWHFGYDLQFKSILRYREKFQWLKRDTELIFMQIK